MNKVILSIFTFLFGFYELSAALTENKEDPVDSVKIEEVTVKAFNYHRKLLQTPGSISIIPLRKISNSENKPILHLLNQVPGVYMQSGSYNTNRLTIRGIGSRTPYSTNKIRAYLEGIPLTNGVGETSIEDLNLSLFSNIEIIKGPSSGYYGSGLGGTILFETRKRDTDKIVLSTNFSSFDTYSQNVSIYLSDDQFTHSLHVNNLSSEGYRENNETDRTNLSYIGKLSLDNHQFNLIINHTGLKAFIPSSIDFDTYKNTPRKAASNWSAIKGYEDYEKIIAGFSVSSNWKRNWKSQLSIFGNRFKNYELRPFNTLQEESDYYGGRFLFEKNINTEEINWDFIFGNETFFENYKWATFENNDRLAGDILSDNDEDRRYFNFFISGNMEFKNGLFLSFGTNLNSTKYNYTDFFLDNGDQSGKHQFETIISPRLNMSYPLTKNQTVYATASHGFSPPTLEETLLPGGQRNNNIKPETGWNYELGSRGILFPGLFYDISAYYMEIKNLLVARRVGEDEFMGINAGKTGHPGFEYLLKLDLINAKYSTIKLSNNGSFSPAYFIDFVDGENDYSNNELTGTPKFTNHTSLNYSFKEKLSVSFQHLHTSKIPLRDDNSIYSDAYSLFNVKSSYKRKWNKLELELTASLFNIFNTKYASMVLINANSFGGNPPRYFYPGLPRNFGFSLKVNYPL